METMNIVFSADDNYAQFMGVTICSLFENKKNNTPVDVYILDGEISIENKKKLKFLSKKYAFNMNFIQINTNLFKDFYISRHITHATYYRIMIPDLLPNIQKALYIDSDTIIIDDISELYHTNIDKYFFAAVEQYGKHRLEELKMPAGTKYFNSWVMLINAKKWRKHKSSQTVIKFIKTHQGILRYQDQDAMNAIMWNKRLPLPAKYNHMTPLMDEYPRDNNELYGKIVIIHYTKLKPWNYLCTNPFLEKYFYYLEKTPWKGRKYVDKNIKNIIIKSVRTCFSLVKNMIKNLRRREKNNSKNQIDKKNTSLVKKITSWKKTSKKS